MENFFTSQAITTPASQKYSPSWSHSLTFAEQIYHSVQKY